MKKHTRKGVFILAIVLILAHGMGAFADEQMANLSVSKNGRVFKLTNNGKSYSFRFDWNKKKENYTRFNIKKIRKVAPSGIYIGTMHENLTDHRNDSVLLTNHIKLNKKVYGGMTLASFHKVVKKAWGKGYYAYWSNEKNGVVKIGSKKPSNSLVQERARDTGMFWMGKRGCLTIDIPIKWNDEKKCAEVSPWIEIYGSAST